MNNQSVEACIDNLAEDLRPVRRFRHPFLRALPWIFVAFLYVTAVVQYLGVRPDLMSTRISDPAFLFEAGMMLAISLSAALAALWLCVPDMRGRAWLPVVPLTLLSGFVFWCVVRAQTEGFAMPEIHWDHCFQDAALMGFLPAVVLVFMTAKGATTRPLTMAFMTVLAVGALGYVGLRFTCMLDTVAHAGLYHIFPFAVFGGVLGFAARRLYRW